MATVSEIQWSAGFLEGEGSFMRTGHGALTVAASQVQKEPLLKLYKWFGGHLYFIKRKRNKKNRNHSDYWTWTVHGSVAASLMMTLYTLLSPRRKQTIVAILKLWRKSLGLNWNSRKTHCKHGHAFSVNNIYTNPRGNRECKTCRLKSALRCRKAA